MAAYQNSGDRLLPLRKPLEPRSFKIMSNIANRTALPLNRTVGASTSRVLVGSGPKSRKINPPQNMSKPNHHRTPFHRFCSLRPPGGR